MKQNVKRLALRTGETSRPMSAERPVYLDHHATTPCDPRVVEAMLPYLTEEYGNAASRTHAFGWRAEEALEQARQRIAQGLCAEPREIVFTTGAPETNNLALLGDVRAPAPPRAKRTAHT